MRSLILSLVVLQLLLPGFLSEVEDRRAKPVMCKNPKAKIGTSILRGCSPATCGKVGNKGVWQQCPDVATQETVQLNQKSIAYNEVLLNENQDLIKENQGLMKQNQGIMQYNQGLMLEVLKIIGADGVVVRLLASLEGWKVKKGDVDAIDFISTSAVLIRGISMFGSFSGSATHTGLIQIKETSDQTILVSETFEYTSNGDPLVYEKLFYSPQFLMPGVKYTITIEYYNTVIEEIWRGVGSSASSAVLCNGNTITFTFSESSDSTNGSNELFGQIPWLLFSCIPNQCPTGPGIPPIVG